MPTTAPTVALPLARRPAAEHKRVGPYSRKGALARLDGRSVEAQYMKTIRDELVVHVGGAPSAVQRQLIERIVRHSLFLEQLDTRLVKDKKPFTIHDKNYYIAAQNAVARMLNHLDMISKRKPKRATGTVNSTDGTVADLLAKQ